MAKKNENTSEAVSMFRDMMAATGNEDAACADSGETAGDICGFTDTGCYTLNALLSGSIYGGMPSNRVTAFAGDPGCGKTFIALSVVKNFLCADPRAAVFYFDTEAAVSKDMLVSREIDARRVFNIPVTTVQEFKTQAVRILDKYLETKGDRPPMLLVLDSLGMLSTSKEIEDTTDGKDTRDMTRAQLIRGAFRVLSLKLAKAKVALIVTNHTGDSIGGMFPEKVMSGGQGLKYAASNIVFIGKRKDKDSGGDVTGVILTFNLKKGRVTKENSKVSTLLNYDRGLNKYYGLLDIAEEAGLIQKVANKYEFPDGNKAFEKSIINAPEKYFNKELLDKIDEACKNMFLYGQKTQETAKESVDEEV